MDFLIQTYNDQIIHDFSFTLLESIRYQQWLGNEVSYKLTNNLDKIITHDDYIPIGSVEFVCEFMEKFYEIDYNPINIPPELMIKKYTQRYVFNGDENDVELNQFIKSTDKIKGYLNIITDIDKIPKGKYQISEYINIDSEWRSFIFEDKLVGLQNYIGDFTLFPDTELIYDMINTYSVSAPVAYTLDIGVNSNGTFIIEVHDFFSCGLYGFSAHKILPYMFYRWFKNFIQTYNHK